MGVRPAEPALLSRAEDRYTTGQTLRSGIPDRLERPRTQGSLMTGPAQLSPSQRAAYDKLMAALRASSIFELRSKPGRGRSTVLQALHSVVGGAFITLRD